MIPFMDHDIIPMDENVRLFVSRRNVYDLLCHQRGFGLTHKQHIVSYQTLP